MKRCTKRVGGLEIFESDIYIYKDLRGATMSAVGASRKVDLAPKFALQHKLP